MLGRGYASIDVHRVAETQLRSFIDAGDFDGGLFDEMRVEVAVPTDL